MNPINDKWNEFGRKLGVPGENLKEFAKKPDPLSQVICYWLRGRIRDKPVTWNHVVDTLISIKEPALANQVEAKNYTQGD